MGNQGQNQGHAITDDLQSRVPGCLCWSGQPGASLPSLGCHSSLSSQPPGGHTLGITEAEVSLRNRRDLWAFRRASQKVSKKEGWTRQVLQNLKLGLSLGPPTLLLQSPQPVGSRRGETKNVRMKVRKEASKAAFPSFWSPYDFQRRLGKSTPCRGLGKEGAPPLLPQSSPVTSFPKVSNTSGLDLGFPSAPRGW